MTRKDFQTFPGFWGKEKKVKEKRFKMGGGGGFEEGVLEEGVCRKISIGRLILEWEGLGKLATPTQLTPFDLSSNMVDGSPLSTQGQRNSIIVVLS